MILQVQAVNMSLCFVLSFLEYPFLSHIFASWPTRYWKGVMLKEVIPEDRLKMLSSQDRSKGRAPWFLINFGTVNKWIVLFWVGGGMFGR